MCVILGYPNGNNVQIQAHLFDNPDNNLHEEPIQNEEEDNYIENEELPEENYEPNLNEGFFVNKFLDLFGRKDTSIQVAQDNVQLIKEILKTLEADLHNLLNQSQGEQEIVDNYLRRVLGSIRNIDTQHKLESHLAESNCFQEAEKVIIYHAEENIKFTLFPLEQKIVKFLELPNMLDNIVENQRILRERSQNNNNTLYNVVNSPLWEAVLDDFEEDDIVIPIFLYNDDFNPDNGLGPHKTSTELTAFYVSFPTLNEHLLSSTENVFIAMMGNAQQLKRFTDVILLRVVDQLRILEHGINVATNTGPKHIFIITIVIVGDNMAQNMIDGFTRTLNANAFCRTCIMPMHDWLIATRENENLLRSEDNYVQGQNGIRQICLFNELRYTNFSIKTIVLLFTGSIKSLIIKLRTTYMIFF